VLGKKLLIVHSLLRAGVAMANQSETKRHIAYCVIAKSHIIHMGTHERHTCSYANHQSRFHALCV